MTDLPIDNIKLKYRLAKSAEKSRIQIEQGALAYVRVYLTSWHPADEPLSRQKALAQSKRVVDAIRKGVSPEGRDALIYLAASELVLTSEHARLVFDAKRKHYRKEAEVLAAQCPGWERLEHIRGFGIWGFTALIGECGDIGNYPGCRHMYKRLGLAPNECYPKGERREGRMVPRNKRGRIMGIIADPLFRQQWRGERDGVAAHAVGPFGQIYGDNKARHLAAGKTKGHADRLARRAMVKSLIHDVHRAWHGQPLDFAGVGSLLHDDSRGGSDPNAPLQVSTG